MGLAVVTEFRRFADNLSADEKVRLSHANRQNLLAAIAAIRSGGHEALEIGCWKGETTAWLLEQRGGDGCLLNVTVVDTFEGSPELGPQSRHEIINAFMENTKSRFGGPTILEGRSAECLPRIPRKFDFIYVDGSHDSRDVILDAALGFDILTDGGVMVFDDYLWNYHDDPFRNPGSAIAFFLNAWAKSITVLHRGYQVTVRKEKA